MHQEICNDYVREKLLTLEKNMTEIKMKYEITAEENRLVVEEEVEHSKAWLMNQESNNKNFCMALDELRDELKNQKEKIKICSEMRAIREDASEYNAFGKDWLDELRNIRADIRELISKQVQTEQSSETQRRQDTSFLGHKWPTLAQYFRTLLIMNRNPPTKEEVIEKASEIASINNEQEESRKMIHVISQEDIGSWKAENNRTAEEMEEKISALNREITGISQKLDVLKNEIDSKVYTTNDGYDSMQNIIKKEIDAIRAEMRAKIRVNSESTNNKTKTTSSEKSRRKAKPVPKVVPIIEEIFGEWKLVSSENINKFCKKNKNHKHEVHAVNAKFALVGNKLTSYYFDGTNYRRLKRKLFGGPDDNTNCWYAEEKCIKSVDYNGFNMKTKATEICTRYIKNGQLIVVNEMGGSVCTRVYEKIR